LYSGILSAVVAFFLTYTFLEPLFVPVGTDPAMVFLYILAINGALVGMALGVLLPLLFPGLCLGTSLALLIGTLAALTTNGFFFPVTGGVLAALFAFLSARYVSRARWDATSVGRNPPWSNALNF
jgi:callose synthase